MAAWLRRATLWLGNQKSEGARSNFLQLNDHIQMHMKLAVAIFLVASMSMYAQAQNRSGGKVSKRNSVPNWDVSSSCRAASQFAYNQSAGEREKACIESENRTREKLAGDWSTFPADERTRCIKSIEWFSPTYTELIACLEMYSDVRRARENAATPDKPRR